MTPSHVRALATALLAATAAAACSAAPQGPPATTPQPVAPQPSPSPAPAATPPTGQVSAAAIAQARADSARHPYTAADVHFMTVMIGHHAQALEMARMAPTHGAGEAVRTLAARIINGQRDEIATMQQWLRERRQPVPDLAAGAHAMHGAAHAGHDAMPAMPGMLTDAQMRELDAARGREFDRLFLTYMIQHHRGAVAMVRQLFGTYGAGQDETVFRFATDVNVDQQTEIQRMERMLVALVLESPSP
jgi:uncharacterized protein (DUF305 family)